MRTKIKGAPGGWKSKIMSKQGRHIHTASSLGRTYFAYPPEEGWPGGEPEKNGWRPTVKSK